MKSNKANEKDAQRRNQPPRKSSDKMSYDKSCSVTGIMRRKAGFGKHACKEIYKVKYCEETYHRAQRLSYQPCMETNLQRRTSSN